MTKSVEERNNGFGYRSRRKCADILLNCLCLEPLLLGPAFSPLEQPNAGNYLFFSVYPNSPLQKKYISNDCI